MTKDRGGWQHPSLMPHGRTVEVKTVTGLLRLARRAGGDGTRKSKAGQVSVHCWRRPKTGDLYAVAWRELTQ